MYTRARTYERAGWCDFGGRGVTNGIRADLAVARTGQCAGIGRMVHVVLKWDT
jgi:hypothetical protein